MRRGTLGRIGPIMVAALLALQPAVTAAQFAAAPQAQSFDVASLERRVADARTQIATARGNAAANSAELSRLDTELDAIDDEVAYLRVKGRRGETVSEKERREVSDRLARLESQIAGRANDSGNPSEIPVGAELDLRLQTPLSSKDAQVEQRVDATTAAALSRGGQVVVPAGSAVRGFVVAVDRATRLDRRGRLVLRFTHLTVGQRTHDVTLSITQALESEGIRGETEKIGVGAGVGAVIGGILGGLKGVLAGILIGGGGAVLATEGKDVELPVGTILRVRFDAPLDLGR
ncbi:MAG: hypothetical protein AB7H93_22955 [Vicinamibacterales bacterium]